MVWLLLIIVCFMSSALYDLVSGVCWLSHDSSSAHPGLRPRLECTEQSLLAWLPFRKSVVGRHSASLQPPQRRLFPGNLTSRISRYESSGAIEATMSRSAEAVMLRNHSREFVKRIEKAHDNIFVAIGYGLANVVLVRTQDGLVIFDTLETPSSMTNLMADWVKFRGQQTLDKEVQNVASSKEVADPKHRWGQKIVGIIYSHFHSDHVFGASAVYEPGVTQVWAHEATAAEISKVFSVVAGTTYARSMRQFGTLLTEEDGYINAGIGSHLNFGGRSAAEKVGLIQPTHVWYGSEWKLQLGGETFQLMFAPGESRDQVIVWFPQKRVLFGADNIYRAFPNIYAIRGTESRDTTVWVRSLDLMRSLRPEVLVLGHTGVLRGESFIYNTLTAYRDAIQYLHDQTVRLANKGLSVADIVERVRLPPHLERHPFLQQFYGTVPWAVRAVFHHYVGWFSGQAEELHSLTRLQKALRMAELVGGKERLLETAFNALEKGDFQWSLELVSHAQLLFPDSDDARRIKASSLRALAGTQLSAPGRNWYLTAAKEALERCPVAAPTSGARSVPAVLYQTIARAVSGEADAILELTTRSGAQQPRKTCVAELLKPPLAQKTQVIRSLKSAVDTFDFVPVRINPELAKDVDALLAFTFTDSHQFVCVHFRRGIAYAIGKCERDPDLHVKTTDLTWRLILTGELNPLVAIAIGKFRLTSCDPRDYFKLKRLMDMFELDW